MINRKQAAELLGRDRHPEATLEALYSGCDAPTKEVLSQFDDLRVRLASLQEVEVRVRQEREDFHALARKIQHALHPDKYTAASLKYEGGDEEKV